MRRWPLLAVLIPLFGAPSSDYLSAKRKFDLIESEINAVNVRLGREGKASPAIARFALLEKPFETGRREMTRTRVVRRSYVTERMKPLIEALFAEAASDDKAGSVTIRIVDHRRPAAEQVA